MATYGHNITLWRTILSYHSAFVNTFSWIYRGFFLGFCFYVQKITGLYSDVEPRFVTFDFLSVHYCYAKTNYLISNSLSNIVCTLKQFPLIHIKLVRLT